MDLDPAEAAFHVKALRVVSAEAFAVPAEPGSPVWSLTAVVALAVNAVLLSMSSHGLARLAELRPAVIMVLQNGQNLVRPDHFILDLSFLGKFPKPTQWACNDLSLTGNDKLISVCHQYPLRNAMTHHLFAVALYRHPRTSTAPAVADKLMDVRSVPNLNPPTPKSRAMVRPPIPSCLNSQITIWPGPGLVGAPRVRFPPRVTEKLRPVLASVAMVGASVRGVGVPR